MKNLRLFIILALVFSCLLALSSCDGLDTLDTPSHLDIEYTTLTLEWKAVKDVRLYTISIQKDGEDRATEYMASKNSYSLAHLDEGKYKIKVRANGKEDVIKDSSWSEILDFEREHESGLVFVLNKEGTEYTVTSKGTATGDIVIPSHYRKKPVTAIDDRAFFNKSDVTSVTFGENVRSIGAFAFANCSYLTTMELPAKLESIGASAFASCRLLSGELVIPGGVSVISKSAFAYCKSLDSLTISDGVAAIEDNAFTDCSGLTGLYIPSSVKSIGTYAFTLCNKISSLTLADGVQTIGDYAFSELAALESVNIPSSVTAIGEGAFYKCSELSSVTLGDGIESISLGAFNDTKIWNSSTTNEVYVGSWFLGCKDKSVAAVNIKDGTVGIAAMALAYYSSISDIVLPDSVKIVDRGAFAGSSLINAVLGSGVEVLGDEAFAGCKELVVAILGSYDTVEGRIKVSSLKSIGSYAFQSCEKLDSIEMPSTLDSVGSYAFRDSGIYAAGSGVVYAGNWAVDAKEDVNESVVIREGTVGIANYSFYKCSAIVSVKLPTTVKIIGRAAFYDCTGLKSIELPSALSEIRDYTFYRCKGLKLFSLPPMLTYIGRSAFYKCGSTAEMKDSDTDNDVLIIPSDVKYIGDFAFYGCGYREKAALSEEADYNNYGIDVIIFPEGIEWIGANAFYGMNSLRRVELGGVKGIGEKAFYKCLSLSEVNFGSSLVEIGEKAFYKCETLTSVNLPATLETVGNYAFYKCIALSELTLGSAKSIGDFAFFGDCSIKALILPDTVTRVGRQAFRKCTELAYVALGSGIEKIEEHAFYGCPALTIYLEGESAPEAWGKRWNSSYRPVVTGCVLSEDGSYIIYIGTVEGGVLNLNASNTVSDPVREGYIFGGWGNNSTATTPSFTSQTISEAEAGRRLYAIWDENETN